MTPAERTAVENIETLKSQISHQICALSSEEALTRARQCLAEAVADIDEALNARRPFLSMPTELLQKIVAFVPDGGPFKPSIKKFRLAWHIDWHDATMLLPVSQTCRRLRCITLGYHSLWTSVARSSPRLSRLLVDQSGDLPLKVFLRVPIPSGWGYRGESDPDINKYHLDDIARDFRSRIQDISMYNLQVDSSLESLFSGPLPMLRSLAVRFTGAGYDAQYSYCDLVRLTKDQVPQLRRLALYSCDIASTDFLSSLTHLALDDFSLGEPEARLTTILSSCHSLESLHLERILDFRRTIANRERIEEYSVPTPHPLPLPALRSLRRLVIVRTYSALTSFVLSLVLAQQPVLAVQLHDIWPHADAHPPFPRHRVFGGISTVVLGRYPQPDPRFDNNTPRPSFVWGLTAFGAQRTLRTTAPTLEGVTEAQPLSPWDATVLVGVRELWLADVLPSADSDPAAESTLPASDAASLRALVRSMPALESVTLINQFQAPWTHARPSLVLLPDAREDAPFAPRPRVVRIAHGYGAHVLDRWSRRPDPVPTVPPLDLTGVLDELSSGAYAYVRELVLEVPSRVVVHEGDVARLRGHIETVRVRVADETPAVALPEYCVEPAAWPDDEPWPYRLW